MESYGYRSLPNFSKITGLERIDQEFFDFRFHFQMTAMVNGEPKSFHVTLDESAVVKSFLSTKVDSFNIPKFSAFFRWAFAEFQNNECVIEGFISMADNQPFDSQNDKTL